jgi:hypothetical protein
MSRSMPKKILLIIPYIIIILSIIIPILLSFGTIDDFIFSNMAYAKKCDNLGYIPISKTNLNNDYAYMPGFDSLIIQISKICNLSYNIISFIPFQLIPLILLIFIIFKNLSNSWIIFSLIILINTTFTYVVGLQVHGIGNVLFFLVIASTILYYKYSYFKQRIILFFIILLSIISLNYLSYKSTFITLIFILSLCFIDYFEYHITKLNKNRKSNNLWRTWLNIFLIGIIIILTFNKFFYDNFLPQIKQIYISGLQRLIIIFGVNPPNPLGNNGFYYSFPIFLNYIKIIRLVLLGIVFLLCIFFILRQLIKNSNKHLSLPHKIFLSLFLTSITLLVIFNLLGSFDIALLTFTALFGVLLLYDYNFDISKKINKRKFAIIIIIFLITLNTVYYVATKTTYTNVTQRDDNYFSYIKPSANWLKTYSTVKTQLKTDILTNGYFELELGNKNTTNYSSILSINDILFITQKTSQHDVSKDNIYAINYRLEFFSIWNWNVLKSLTYIKNEIGSNPNLNKIYSSNSISFYSPS